MCVAYNSKNLTFPAEVLQDLLLYNNIKEVLDDCKHYDIPVQDNKIVFAKTCFNNTKPQVRKNYLCM